jgi:hypothetical protein
MEKLECNSMPQSGAGHTGSRLHEPMSNKMINRGGSKREGTVGSDAICLVEIGLAQSHRQQSRQFSRVKRELRLERLWEEYPAQPGTE